MAENSAQDKTEEPTEKRRRKAREDGQVARSKELNTVVLLLLHFTGLLWFADSLWQMINDVMATTMQLDKARLSTDQMALALTGSLLSMMRALLPLLTLVFVAMWIAGSLPGGMLFSKKLLGFKASKLNPLSGLGRMVGKQSLVELVKSLLKIALLSLCLYTFLSQLSERLLKLQLQALPVALQDGLGLLMLMLMITASLLLLVAAIDVPFQQKSVADKIKMTRQEVKEERKSSDGSPEVKNRIRQIQYQLANRKIEDRVPQADVIITNPTHFAVAIKYSEKEAKAPYVVAKGVDEMALRIRAVARQHNKTVLELPPLARAVYHSTRVDQEVPAGLYSAVAYVLTYVMQLKAYKAGRGQAPAPLPDLKIPTGLVK